MAFQQDYKLADYFSVIGLDEELKSIEQSQEGKFTYINYHFCLYSMNLS